MNGSASDVLRYTLASWAVTKICWIIDHHTSGLIWQVETCLLRRLTIHRNSHGTVQCAASLCQSALSQLDVNELKPLQQNRLAEYNCQFRWGCQISKKGRKKRPNFHFKNSPPSPRPLCLFTCAFYLYGTNGPGILFPWEMRSQYKGQHRPQVKVSDRRGHLCVPVCLEIFRRSTKFNFDKFGWINQTFLLFVLPLPVGFQVI